MAFNQLELHFAHFIPRSLFPKNAQKQNSRDRVYNQLLTFWGFLWQTLTPQTSCREVVRQVQSLFKLHRQDSLSHGSAAFCKARKRLPMDTLTKALDRTAILAQQRASNQESIFEGRRIKLVDGTSMTLSDTPANREAFPKTQVKNKETSFPMIRMVGLFCLKSAAMLSAVSGNFHQSENGLFVQLIDKMSPGDIIVGDRGFCGYVLICLLGQRQVDFIGRCKRKFKKTQARQRLGRYDWIVCWKRGASKAPFLSEEQSQQIPEEKQLRIVRGSIHKRGFRVVRMTLATTLLDAKKYPAEQILMAYCRRWQLEMCFDDIKTSMGMETLRCKSPDMVRKEMYMFLIAHNLIRLLILESVNQYHAPLYRISFKGSIDALRQFSMSIQQAKTKNIRHALWEELLRILSLDLVPHRPDRREPRAVKRKKNKYDRLSSHRSCHVDTPKRHTRRKLSRQRAKQNPVLSLK